jgi:ABC-type lipoprotein export system ATPase subunit
VPPAAVPRVVSESELVAAMGPSGSGKSTLVTPAGMLVTHEARHAAGADRVVFLRDGVVVDTSGPLDQPDALFPRGSTS